MFRGRRTLAILNPTSGARRGEDVAADLEEALLGHGAVAAEVRVTGGPDDALDWATSAAEEGFDLMVAGGGDGTVTAVAQGVFRSGADTPVAVLPLGTGNGLARVLGIPLDPDGALEALASGRPVKLDVIDVRSHGLVSLLFCGAGLDARINEEADREAKDRLGFLAYVLATLKSARELKRHDLVVTLDDRSVRLRGHTVIAFNATRVAVLGVELGPDSYPHDGRMDVSVIRSRGTLAVLRRALRLLGRHESRSQMTPATRLRVEATPPLPVQVDGDPVGETPLEAEVVPAAVTCVAPADYAGAAGSG